MCMANFNVYTIVQVDELDTEVENGSAWLNTQRSSRRESLLGPSGISRLRTKARKSRIFRRSSTRARARMVAVAAI